MPKRGKTSIEVESPVFKRKKNVGEVTKVIMSTDRGATEATGRNAHKMATQSVGDLSQIDSPKMDCPKLMYQLAEKPGKITKGEISIRT